MLNRLWVILLKVDFNIKPFMSMVYKYGKLFW